MERGYVQVYTGNGKGKTTASLGLLLRAVSAGKKVFIGQFTKGMKYSELNMLEKIELVTNRQYGKPGFIRNTPGKDDIRLAQEGLAEIKSILETGEYDLVILDEANIALYYKLFSFEELWDAVSHRKPHVEVVITGRYAPDELIKKADLVTEMKEIKHYYTQGVPARTGIEK